MSTLIQGLNNPVDSKIPRMSQPASEAASVRKVEIFKIKAGPVELAVRWSGVTGSSPGQVGLSLVAALAVPGWLDRAGDAVLCAPAQAEI